MKNLKKAGEHTQLKVGSLERINQNNFDVLKSKFKNKWIYECESKTDDRLVATFYLCCKKPYDTFGKVVKKVFIEELVPWELSGEETLDFSVNQYFYDFNYHEISENEQYKNSFFQKEKWYNWSIIKDYSDKAKKEYFFAYKILKEE